jgi:LacI family transcriptional regulator
MLALGWYDHRLHRGVERYARIHGWSITMDCTRSRVVPWGWEGDGILAWLAADDELAEFVAGARKPTVDFSRRRPHLKFTRVLEDTAEAARLAADHLLSRGVRRFLFYIDAANWVYEERGAHFVRQLDLAGHDVHWLRWHESTFPARNHQIWKAKHRWLTNEIRTLPKPVGVFAGSDELAADVLAACESAGFSVPGEVAIVGAGDSLLAVNAMSTPITSVDTNLELLGYRGAQELDRVIRSGRSNAPAVRTIRVAPAGVIARKSSDILAVTHAGVARSVRFIQDNYRLPIAVGQLAEVASMSLRAFHEEFASRVGRGPGAELQRVRVEHAKWLLKKSREKLLVIAGECGYASSNSFSVAFKNATGLSPGDYRSRFVIPG